MNLKTASLWLTFAIQCISLDLCAQMPPDKDGREDVTIVELKEDIPNGAEKIDDIKVGDGMRISCTYEKTLEIAKEKARKLGGNLVKITEHKYPDGWSSCHRIKAEVYKISGPIILPQKANTGAWKQLIQDTAQYALVCLYRPGNYAGPAMKARIFANEKLVSRLRNNSRQIIKVHKEGPLTIWAETEKRDEVELDIKFGEVYFIRAEIGMGIVMARVHLSNTTNKDVAYDEFINTKKEQTESEENE